MAAQTCLLTLMTACPLQVLLAAFQRQLARRMPTHEEASLQAARDKSAAAQAPQWPLLVEEKDTMVASRSMLRPQAACKAAHVANKPAAGACGGQEAPQESNSTEVGLKGPGAVCPVPQVGLAVTSCRLGPALPSSSLTLERDMGARMMLRFLPRRVSRVISVAGELQLRGEVRPKLDLALALH